MCPRKKLLVNPTETTGIKHLKVFLMARLLAHNTGDINPYVVSTELLAALKVFGATVGKKVFIHLFPIVAVVAVLPLTGEAPVQNPKLAAIVAAITVANQAMAANNTLTTPSKKLDNAKMSKGELATLLQMCGKSCTGDLTNVAAYLQDCSDKGMTDP